MTNLEYCKSTAEALGFEWFIMHKKNIYIKHKFAGPELWEPGKDANQMLMVWKWFKEQGALNLLYVILYGWIYNVGNESLFTATHKAFEAYIGEN